jgi:uncharacterized RDD family membrane protein YckC
MDLLNDLLPEYTLARKTKRWFASLIDYLLLIAFLVIVIISFGQKEINEDGSVSYNVNNIGGLGILALEVIPWLLILPGIEYFNDGQTIGKRMLRVKVVLANSDRVSFGRCLARHLLDPVDYFPFLGIIGLLVASNNPNKQRIGDLVAKTIVIDA